MSNLAASYIALGRHAEAAPFIEEALARVRSTPAHPEATLVLLEQRVLVLKERPDPNGCLETAATREALNATDADNLYKSACIRALCAEVIHETDKTPQGETKANEQADRAMAWLKQAVTAGFTDVDKVRKDEELHALRDRTDFRQLIDEMDRRRTAASTTSTAQ